VILLSELLLKDFDDDLFIEGQVHYLSNMIFPVASEEKVLNSLCKYHELSVIGNKNKVCISYLGHLIESKGYRRALEISKKIVANNRNIMVNFYGEFGSNIDTEYFNSFIKSNGLENHVFYAGAFPRNQIWNAFENTHLMIFPSYTEAYPLTILEAISVGIPVVATDTGAVSEIIGDYSGKVIRFSNSESDYIDDFVRSILDILGSWEISMSLKSIDYFKLNWSESKFNESLVSIFNY
jgi:glycosyltransferase involved in cell wall biosynthesis